LTISDLTLTKVRINMLTIFIKSAFNQPQPMAEVSEKSLLKVCCTCNFWSSRYKGFCHRLEQGVGKFWICEDWEAVPAETEKPLPDTQATTGAGAMTG